MGSLHPEIDARLTSFVSAQPVFFVATAPMSPDGHVNCSPKGNDGTFAVLDQHRVAYLDLTGSGVETIAHLRENGRIVLMFCSFSGPPRIVRLHGVGSVVELGDPRFSDLCSRFRARAGARAVIVVEVARISDSCGYAVPVMEFAHHRSNLDHWVEKKGGDEGLVDYRALTNAVSIDGLRGYAAAETQQPPGSS